MYNGTILLIIKCADILDNSDYYSFGNDQMAERPLTDKLKYFLQVAESRLKTIFLFKNLKKKYRMMSLEMKRSKLK